MYLYMCMYMLYPYILFVCIRTSIKEPKLGETPGWVSVQVWDSNMAGPWPRVTLLLERGVLMPELPLHSGTDLASVMWLGRES